MAKSDIANEHWKFALSWWLLRVWYHACVMTFLSMMLTPNRAVDMSFFHNDYKKLQLLTALTYNVVLQRMRNIILHEKVVCAAIRCGIVPMVQCCSLQFRRRKSDSIFIWPSSRFCIHFTLGCSGKFSKQATLWRWSLGLMVNVCAVWCGSPGSKSKKHDKILIRNWNVMQLNLISFLDWVAPAERFLYGCYWDPKPERRVPWG